MTGRNALLNITKGTQINTSCSCFETNKYPFNKITLEKKINDPKNKSIISV